MQNTYAVFILTTKKDSTNKTKNKSKKMLYICLLLWNPKMSTTSMLLKTLILKTTQLQSLLKAQTIKLKDNTRSRSMGHYDNDRTPPSINIVQNAQVQITGTNLC